jgi:hypothetical protein
MAQGPPEVGKEKRVAWIQYPCKTAFSEKGKKIPNIFFGKLAFYGLDMELNRNRSRNCNFSKIGTGTGTITFQKSEPEPEP